MDRREFAVLVSGLVPSLSSVEMKATPPVLPVVESGVFKPGPSHAGSVPKRFSQAVTRGVLKAGNIQLEIHETRQEVGAPHEPIETHLHSEIWLVREGTVELTVNGVARKMEAGDVGICVAGDKHYIPERG